MLPWCLIAVKLVMHCLSQFYRALPERYIIIANNYYVDVDVIFDDVDPQI